MEILRTERLSKTYGQGPAATQALRDVTFSVEQGSFSAIVGRSGSGKTTLLNLLGGLDTPTAGQVFYRGQSLYDLPRRQRDGFRRRRIGYVFQFFNLVPEFTAAENVCLPAMIAGRTLKEAEKQLSTAFSRCNNSFIVNLRYLSHLENADAVVGSERLPVSRGRRKAFLEDVNRYLGGI